MQWHDMKDIKSQLGHRKKTTEDFPENKIPRELIDYIGTSHITQKIQRKQKGSKNDWRRDSGD